jgi:hypothetical protein
MWKPLPLVILPTVILVWAWAGFGAVKAASATAAKAIVERSIRITRLPY